MTGVRAYAKLPALLEKIGTLESGQTLCRRRWCYAETFSWMSPFCPRCTPGGGYATGGYIPGPPQLFHTTELGCVTPAYAVRRMLTEHMLGRHLAAMTVDPRSFIRISSAC